MYLHSVISSLHSSSDCKWRSPTFGRTSAVLDSRFKKLYCLRLGAHTKQTSYRTPMKDPSIYIKTQTTPLINKSKFAELHNKVATVCLVWSKMDIAVGMKVSYHFGQRWSVATAWCK